MRFLRALAVVVVATVVAGVAVGTWTVRRSFPTTEGTMTMAALDGPVTVTRTEAGVPHITATTLEDLFRAQGYVHAQDRFWQMDTWRHIGAGRLAEMFGESQVGTDSFLRTLGFEHLAAEAYSTMPAAFGSALDAYAEGVNAYLEERPGGGTPLSRVCGPRFPERRIRALPLGSGPLADLGTRDGVGPALQPRAGDRTFHAGGGGGPRTGGGSVSPLSRGPSGDRRPRFHRLPPPPGTSGAGGHCSSRPGGGQPDLRPVRSGEALPRNRLQQLGSERRQDRFGPPLTGQ